MEIGSNISLPIHVLMHSVNYVQGLITMHTRTTENTLKLNLVAILLKSIFSFFPNMQLFLRISEHRLF